MIARIELGQTSPTWDTLSRLVDASGFDIEPLLHPRAVVGSHMLRDVQRIRALSPEARLEEPAALRRLLKAARRA